LDGGACLSRAPFCLLPRGLRPLATENACRTDQVGALPLSFLHLVQSSVLTTRTKFSQENLTNFKMTVWDVRMTGKATQILPLAG